MKRIQTTEDVGMAAYQIFGCMFMGDSEHKFSEDEQGRILDWFSMALEGKPIGDLETHSTPLPAFEGEPQHNIAES